ncbi:uncharacterized protein LOC133315385 [Gastrolobium bilobum]|uniref:uncharacterized protein LOC133315385 n=1 Tax=Gastrolobium bilobum TaxID=150636 RepID=UPI002AB2AA09|nr:uncharacterized protein LOC133315385 [Gastrolobium bilobum]
MVVTTRRAEQARAVTPDGHVQTVHSNSPPSMRSAPVARHAAEAVPPVLLSAEPQLPAAGAGIAQPGHHAPIHEMQGENVVPDQPPPPGVHFGMPFHAAAPPVHPTAYRPQPARSQPDELAIKFQSHFATSRSVPKSVHSLEKIRQQSGESLRSFLDRFDKEALQVQGLDPKVQVHILLSGLRAGPFAYELARHEITELEEVRKVAQEYMRVEEYKGSRADDAYSQEKATSKNKSPAEDSKKGHKSARYTNRPSRRDTTGPQTHSVLQTDYKDDSRGNQRPQQPAREVAVYCKFHRSNDHSTEECMHLKDEIDELIKSGAQRRDGDGARPSGIGRRYRERSKSPERRRTRQVNFRPRHERDRKEDSPRSRRAQASPNDSGRRDDEGEDPANVKHGVINMISGGLSGGGETSNARKKHLKQCVAVAGKVISKIDSSPTRPKIVWDNNDVGDVLPGHDDPLVIQAIIANYGVNRVFVDHGSSADILFLPCFRALGFTVDDLTPVAGELSGFNATTTKPLGVISLRLSLGTPPTSKSADIQFLVLDTPSAYNAILGRRMFAAFEASISHPHLVMKFVARDNKVATVKGDQIVARRPAKKGGAHDQCFLVEFYARDDPRVEHARPTPDGALEHVVLGDNNHQTTTIGATLDPETKDRLIKLLRDNRDLFAWKPSDMPGIDPEVCFHRLSIDPKAKPISQKKRKFGVESQKIINEEVKRLHDAGFIREIKYTTWLSNLVLVKKPNGAWRMCVDYTDLNKVCPKDAYPFPSIDQLVDNASGFKILSFMDAYSGYNQIPLLEKDQCKTAFITQNANYCYTMMPFGLKNAGATYQRMMNEVFRDLISNCIEVYIDDMIAKSRTPCQHLTDLQGVFDRLRKFNMRLNPSKCAFGVLAGKFLGFMLTERGIEVNPDKCKSPQKGNAFRWSEECEKAFQEFKRALSCPPVLTKPDSGETVYLYLAVGTEAVGAALVQESKEGGQKPIYFISKVLQGAELRYQQVENVALTLIFAARRLRPYFQCHPITVRTNQPIRKVLHKPDIAGRMMSWAIELSEYQITYEPRTAIKAQALTDFITEMTQAVPPRDQSEVTPSSEMWKLYVDGSSNAKGSGAGMIVENPDGVSIEHSLSFEFNATNNQAEYEAMIAGLIQAREMGARRLKVFSDSQLVTFQISGEYQTKGPLMCKYLEKVKELIQSFESVEVEHIRRAENTRADILAKLASTKSPGNNRSVIQHNMPNPCIVMSISPPAPEAAERTWIAPIINYLAEGIVPPDQKEARKILRKVLISA